MPEQKQILNDLNESKISSVSIRHIMVAWGMEGSYSYEAAKAIKNYVIRQVDEALTESASPEAVDDKGSILNEIKELRRFFRKGSPLTNMLDEIIKKYTPKP